MKELESIISRSTETIFFDISDSGGVIYEKGLDLCNIYYKKQKYNDHDFISNMNTTEPRMHFNYYINNYNCQGESDIPSNYSHCDSEKIKNIKVSWNLGLGDYRTLFNESNFMNKYLTYFQTRIVARQIKLPGYKFNYSSIPYSSRENDIIACFNAYSNGNKLIRLHRHQTSAIVDGLKTKFDIINGFLPLHEYYQNLKYSKFALSPFGWGAICWKDFEIFISGTLLIKPDMSHIKTWPNYYIENETYVPYKWDASDLKSTIEHFYSNTDISERIACAGQDKYKYYNVFNNPEPFLNRFQEIFN